MSLLEPPNAEHELLGDPVEERAERQRGAAGVRPALDRAVDREVRERAGAEPERDGERARLLHALGEQLEAHRADQRARAEREDEPDRARRPRAGEREQGAEHERGGGERAPADGGHHGANRTRSARTLLA
jgi:hypothetical protein